jgi:hypothetical protein
MVHELVEALARGGLTTEEKAVAHRSFGSQPVHAMVAHRDRGEIERRMQTSRGMLNKVWTVVRQQCDGGRASALSSDGAGAIEDGRRRTSGVGGFIEGGGILL